MFPRTGTYPSLVDNGARLERHLRRGRPCLDGGGALNGNGWHACNNREGPFSAFLIYTSDAIIQGSLWRRSHSPRSPKVKSDACWLLGRPSSVLSSQHVTPVAIWVDLQVAWMAYVVAAIPGRSSSLPILHCIVAVSFVIYWSGCSIVCLPLPISYPGVVQERRPNLSSTFDNKLTNIRTDSQSYSS